ncbi:MAG: alpha/beta fold hydrolase [Bernardetiaceae bacterium]|jgi:haloalkane dehalogenase|nr:alpha/beta fold hydrolase [Bernardetiaceae bacterium]
MIQTRLQTRFPHWLNPSEYPFANHYLDLPAGRLHYVDEGAGDPIVFVHGNPGWSFEFRNVIKPMLATHRCVAPDHLGFGLSDKPPHWDYLPQQHADHFAQLLDHLQLDNLTLVVSDWGGPIGLSYVIRYPHKVRKIVILNSWLWSVASDPYYRRFSGFMGGPVGRFLITRFNFFGKVIVKKALGDPSKLTKEVHRHYYQHLAEPADRKGCCVFPEQIIGASSWLDSLWAQRQKINQLPTTLIWGLKDIAFREQELAHWLAHWPAPEVIKLAGVGHYPQEEAPDVVVRALRQS